MYTEATLPLRDAFQSSLARSMWSPMSPGAVGRLGTAQEVAAPRHSPLAARRVCGALKNACVVHCEEDTGLTEAGRCPLSAQSTHISRLTAYVRGAQHLMDWLASENGRFLFGAPDMNMMGTQIIGKFPCS